MKLKKQYSTCSLSKRINGKMITFDAVNTAEKDYKFFYENGFEECFEIEKEEVKEVKTIEFKNDIETPIKVVKKKNYDVPNDNRKKK